MNNIPKPQKYLTYLTWTFAGLMALGGFLGVINDTLDIVTLPVSIIGTVLIIGFYFGAQQYLKHYPWQIGTTRITSLKFGTALPLIGMIFLLWLPPILRGLPSQRDFPPAAADETLIIITTFYRAEGMSHNAEIHNEIRRAIQANIDELDLGSDVQVKVETSILRTENRDGAEALGNRYNATLIIWGEETSARIEVNFLNLKEPSFFVSNISINETEKTQLARLDAYSQFIINELPYTLVYLSFYALAQTEYIRSNYDQAIMLMKTAIETLPGDSQITVSDLALDAAYYGLGVMYQSKELLMPAVDAYNQAIIINPEYAKAFTNRGSVYYKLGEFEQAIANFDQAIALNPDNTIIIVALNNRGLAYVSQGQIELAINNYNQAIALNSQDADLFNNRGIAYTHMEMYEQAIADFDQAITLNPQDAAIFYNRGLTYYHQGVFQQAIINHDQALALNSEYVDALIERGNAYDELGDYEEAIADYDQAIALSPQNARAYFNRGIVYDGQADHVQSMADYNRAIDLNPEYALAFQYRGNLYDELGEYEHALADYNQAIALDPDEANAFYNRGIAYLSQEEYEQATADFSQAIVLNPELAFAFHGRGLSYYYQGKYDQSLSDFRHYLDLDSQSPQRETIEIFIGELEALVED